MSRKSKPFVVTDDGRDKGKRFLITEMSAEKAEEWGVRALGAMIRAGVDLPDLVMASGMAGVVSVGFMALFAAPFAELKPLLDELLACVESCAEDPKSEVRTKVFENDIEEPRTLLLLRMEAFELCAGFSVAAAFSTLREQTISAAMAAKALRDMPTSDSEPPA
jgi:hypothetical protein